MGMTAHVLWGQGEREQRVGHGGGGGFPCLAHLCPFSQASPSVTSVSPVSILKVEVFPAPFTPRRPKHCGARTGVMAAPALPAVASVHLSSTHLPRGNGHAEPVHRRSLPAPVHLCGRAEAVLGAPHPSPASGTGGYGRGWSPAARDEAGSGPTARTLVRSFSSRRWLCGGVLPTLARSLATSWSSSPSEGSCRARGLGATVSGALPGLPAP